MNPFPHFTNMSPQILLTGRMNEKLEHSNVKAAILEHRLIYTGVYDAVSVQQVAFPAEGQPLFISHPTEGRRLSWPGCLLHTNTVHTFILRPLRAVRCYYCDLLAVMPASARL